MALDLETLVVQIQANTSDIDNKMRLLNASVNNALGAVENRTQKMTGIMQSHFLSLSRITRNFSLGFAALEAFRFGENIVQNFDKITEAARKYGIEVDDSLGAKMKSAEATVSEAWTRMQLAAAPALASMSQGVADLINQLSGTPRNIEVLTNALRQAREEAEQAKRGGGFNPFPNLENPDADIAKAANATKALKDLEDQRIRAGRAEFSKDPFGPLGRGIPFAPAVPIDAALAERIKKDAAADQAARDNFTKAQAAQQLAFENNNYNLTRDLAEKIRAQKFADADAIKLHDQALAEEDLSIKNANYTADVQAAEEVRNQKIKFMDDVARFQEEQTRRLRILDDQLGRGIIDQIASFGDTMQQAGGKFGKAVEFMIADIVRLIAKFEIAKTLEASFGSFNIGSGIGSFFGSIFGAGKAGGGDVYPGTVYPVGERGPELFMPRVPGVIVPNGTGAGSPSVVHVVIGASPEFDARMVRVSAGTATQVVAHYDRNTLPSRIGQLALDPYRK